MIWFLMRVGTILSAFICSEGLVSELLAALENLDVVLLVTIPCRSVGGHKSQNMKL
jgi:hypothetical protein